MAVAKKRTGNVNRLLLSSWASGSTGEDRLWDREGRQWQRARTGLPRERAVQLFMDPSTPVAVHDGGGTLQWIEPGDRRARWPALMARTFDKAWKPPPSAPGTLPFEAQEWRADDDVLLLFEDHD